MKITDYVDTIWHRYVGRPYKLAVHDHGGNGPVIILLHGIAASSDKWNELIPLLKSDFRCITIDLIGFGTSPKPQWYGYTMDDHLRSIELTIRRLRLRGPFCLAGHSLGSLLASRYARHHPQQIRELLLLSPPVYAQLDSITSKTARTRNKLLLQIYRFLRSHPRMTPDNLRRLSYILPVPKSIIRHPETRLPFMHTLEQCIENQTISEDMSYVTVPVAIFYGTLDQVVVPFNIRALQAMHNVHVIRIPAVNHDIGKRYAKKVAQFLLYQKNEQTKKDKLEHL